MPPFKLNSHNECSTYEVEEATIDQFTNLYDKNRKEIYEGDILQFIHNGNKYICVVGWNDKVGAWCIRLEYEYVLGCKPLAYWLSDYPFEKIGDVHNNPELLKGGNE